MNMMVKDMVVKYYKVVLAQLGGYALAWYLVTYVFLGPLPVVSPSFKRNVVESPKVIVRTVKTVPAQMVEFASSVLSRAGKQTSSNLPVSQGHIPPPWVMTVPTPMENTEPTVVPTTIPTEVPIPTVTQEGSIDQMPQPTQPSQVRPTQRPQAPQPTRTPPPPTAIPQPTTPVSLGQKEQETIDEINKRRQQARVPAVRANAQLSQAARAHAMWMNGGTGISRCSHTGSGGSDPSKRAKVAGYSGYVGEIIGCGHFTSQSVVQGWMDSPGHKVIMLSGSKSTIGVGWSGTMSVAMFGN